MFVTGDLFESLEKRFKEILDTDGVDNATWDKYIKLLNKLNRYTDTTISIIKDVEFDSALPPAITDRLYSLGFMKEYIIGKTLYEKYFVYNNEITFNTYFNIYISLPIMIEYMIKNDDFLVAVHNSKQYSALTKEQLIVYNDWDQNIELFKTVMEKLPTDDERKAYILKMRKLESSNDSYEFYRYINNGELIPLLLDEKVFDKVKFLLWQEHKKYIRTLTRSVNEYKKAS